MSEQLVEVKDLKVTYYQNGVETPVVRNVSFEIKKNETLGLVGESGSGKSVTSKAIMRLIAEPPGKIANGEILFEGGRRECQDRRGKADAEGERKRYCHDFSGTNDILESFIYLRKSDCRGNSFT